MSAKDDKEIVAMQTAYGALADLKPEEQKRIITWLAEKLDIGGPALGSQGQAGSAAAHQDKPQGPGAGVTPKEFLKDKKPKTDKERITCLAYYLTHYKGTAQFKTKQLTALNSEAAQPPFSNPRVAVDNAAKAQFLTQAGGGNKQITARGEAVVQALSDREAVKAALEANPMARRHKKRAKR